ncbi:putative N6-adenine methyltransferase-domain-containing protein [Podospora aff. communis PSN243]|uniref:Protein-lysine N-methyltransferase EFM5 n=1 Tax=Podospora aff. communis PSN243 TaxID=3040156 RepID=A0AAV9GY00_9PEZI|nr:putative N6-adenine methyltransferase-domain-containing protein [Podospora aff. communis PSN243]
MLSCNPNPSFTRRKPLSLHSPAQSLTHPSTHPLAQPKHPIASLKMTNPESDDELTLSSSALDALKEFYAERDAHAEKFAKLQADAEERLHGQAPLSMDLFAEDWNKSQFWYSEETANQYARQLLEGATEDMTIAILSAPSVFVALMNILKAADTNQPRPKIILLEYDTRFEVFPEYIFYDYMQPLKLPSELKGTVDRIIIDPPFLSEDCHTKAALTARWLTRPASNVPSPILIVSTGERMGTIISKLYRTYNVRNTTFEPLHARGLSNEFCCYASFEADGVWAFRDGEAPAEELQGGEQA